MPHCRSPLQGDQAIGVTGGWVVDVVVVVRRADVEWCGAGGPADGVPWSVHPAAARAAARTTRSTSLGRVVTRPSVARAFPRNGSPFSRMHDESRAGGPGSRGRAGGSARAEYERRRAKDEGRLQAVFGRLAPLVALLAGPKRSTEAWGRGAEGEERVGRWLDDAVGRRGVVLHDRAIPRRRANLDHLVVVPAGIWVVDTKHYRGTLERRESAGWFVARPRLVVGGRDKSALVAAARRQQALVAEARHRGARRRGTRRRSARPRRAVLHRRGAPALHPTLPPRRRVGDVAPGPRPDVGRARSPRSRRTAPGWPTGSPGSSRPTSPDPSPAVRRTDAPLTGTRCATRPGAPPTGPPGPRPSGSGRAGARPTWRAPCAAACPAAASRP